MIAHFSTKLDLKKSSKEKYEFYTKKYENRSEY